jgi:hypothetical protein
LSHRGISASTGISKGSVADYLDRADAGAGRLTGAHVVAGIDPALGDREGPGGSGEQGDQG